MLPSLNCRTERREKINRSRGINGILPEFYALALVRLNPATTSAQPPTRVRPQPRAQSHIYPRAVSSASFSSCRPCLPPLARDARSWHCRVQRMGFRSQLAALGACSLMLLLVNGWQRSAVQPVRSRRLVYRQPRQPSVAAQHGVVPTSPPAAAAATTTAALPAGASPLEETCEGVKYLELVRLPRSNAFGCELTRLPRCAVGRRGRERRREPAADGRGVLPRVPFLRAEHRRGQRRPVQLVGVEPYLQGAQPATLGAQHATLGAQPATLVYQPATMRALGIQGAQCPAPSTPGMLAQAEEG